MLACGMYALCDPVTRSTPGAVTDERVRVQTYIDDTVFYGLSEPKVRAAQDAYARCVSAAGLIIRTSKCVPPTCDDLECIGLEVDGRAHTVCLSPPKLDALICDTLALAGSKSPVSGLTVSRPLVVGFFGVSAGVRCVQRCVPVHCDGAVRPVPTVAVGRARVACGGGSCAGAVRPPLHACVACGAGL